MLLCGCTRGGLSEGNVHMKQEQTNSLYPKIETTSSERIGGSVINNG